MGALHASVQIATTSGDARTVPVIHADIQAVAVSQRETAGRIGTQTLVIPVAIAYVSIQHSHLTTAIAARDRGGAKNAG